MSIVSVYCKCLLRVSFCHEPQHPSHPWVYSGWRTPVRVTSLSIQAIPGHIQDDARLCASRPLASKPSLTIFKMTRACARHDPQHPSHPWAYSGWRAPVRVTTLSIQAIPGHPWAYSSVYNTFMLRARARIHVRVLNRKALKSIGFQCILVFTLLLC